MSSTLQVYCTPWAYSRLCAQVLLDMHINVTRQCQKLLYNMLYVTEDTYRIQQKGRELLRPEHELLSIYNMGLLHYIVREKIILGTFFCLSCSTQHGHKMADLAIVDRSQTNDYKIDTFMV